MTVYVDTTWMAVLGLVGMLLIGFRLNDGRERGIRGAVERWAGECGFEPIAWRRVSGWLNVLTRFQVRVNLTDPKLGLRQLVVGGRGGIFAWAYKIDRVECEETPDVPDEEGEWWPSAASRWARLEGRIRDEVRGCNRVTCQFTGAEHPVELEKGLAILRAAVLKGALASHQTLIDDGSATIWLKVWDLRSSEAAKREL